MDKVRYAGDLSQDEVPNLFQAFPEDEPHLEDDLDPIQVTEQPNADDVMLVPKQTTEVGEKSKLQGRQNSKITPSPANRYHLRPR